MPQGQTYLSIADAIMIFDIGRDTLYRLIHDKAARSFNLGQRMTRICRSDSEERFNLRPFDEKRKVINEMKTYHFEPEDCYTIEEITREFKINSGTVYLHIRKYSIPIRQIGSCVHVPKSEINQLYK